jgi:uncharacterized protein (DUF4415 family)
MLRKPSPPPPKQRITIWLDSDLLLFFKGDGKRGYQTRINRALRETAGTKLKGPHELEIARS